MNGTSITDPKRLERINNPCKRGDIIAWAQMRDYSYAGRVLPPVALYTIGIVKSVTRGGLVKTADDGFGAPVPVHFDVDSAAVSADRIDLDKARAWLASDANYPRRGSTPLRSMDEVRAVVRGWLKEG